jgi:hypothetical protein
VQSTATVYDLSAERQHLSPARYAHINPYGKYRFNVEGEFDRIVANEHYVFGFFLRITADCDICLRAASREIQHIWNLTRVSPPPSEKEQAWSAKR